MPQQDPDFRAHAGYSRSLMMAWAIFFQEADEEKTDEHAGEAK
jgi:hypothetical protein